MNDKYNVRKQWCQDVSPVCVRACVCACVCACDSVLLPCPLLCGWVQDLMPFAVIGSDHVHNVGGKQVLGRQSKWGLVEVENKKHCEFAYLRDMLIRWALQSSRQDQFDNSVYVARPSLTAIG